MDIIREADQLTANLLPLKIAGRTIGLVPTMGALHEGHLSLIERCRRECDVVVVSVFVNPTQFNNADDLRTYPRTEEADAALLESAGVDYAFFPTVEEIYPEPDTRVFDLGPIAEVMEGPRRPGHFNGVAQVVSRLFEIVEPDKAYFGEKDYQQIAVIKKMVELLGLDVEIVDCPIKRGADGLALSSRNALLTPAHREAAPGIYRALTEGRALVGTLPMRDLERRIAAMIDANKGLKTEYCSIVDATTLQPAEDGSKGPWRVCVAVQAGNVRLIDNMAY